MKSGLLLSSIFTIWIVSALVAIYMLMPDITNTIDSVRAIEATSQINDSINTTENTVNTDLINYTPLSIFEIIGF